MSRSSSTANATSPGQRKRALVMEKIKRMEETQKKETESMFNFLTQGSCKEDLSDCLCNNEKIQSVIEDWLREDTSGGFAISVIVTTSGTAIGGQTGFPYGIRTLGTINYVVLIGTLILEWNLSGLTRIVSLEEYGQFRPLGVFPILKIERNKFISDHLYLISETIAVWNGTKSRKRSTDLQFVGAILVCLSINITDLFSETSLIIQFADALPMIEVHQPVILKLDHGTITFRSHTDLDVNFTKCLNLFGKPDDPTLSNLIKSIDRVYWMKFRATVFDETITPNQRENMLLIFQPNFNADGIETCFFHTNETFSNPN